MIERVKGQGSKAVSLSASLTQTRSNAEALQLQPDAGPPELEALDLDGGADHYWAGIYETRAAEVTPQR